MRDHGAQIGHKVGVARGALVHRQLRAGFAKGFPFAAQNVGAEVLAISLGEAFVRKLQVGAEAGIDRFQPVEGSVDFRLFRRQFGRPGLLVRQHPVLRDKFQQLLEWPLVLVAFMLQARKLDVRIDAGDEEVKHHRVRHHEEDADERQLLSDPEVAEPLMDGTGEGHEPGTMQEPRHGFHIRPGCPSSSNRKVRVRLSLAGIRSIIRVATLHGQTQMDGSPRALHSSSRL